MLNKRFKKLSTLFIVIFCITLIFSLPLVCYADAEVAGTYGTKDASTLWYFGENFLNFNNAKQIINSWDKTKLASIGTIYIGVIDTGINTSHEIFDNTIARDSSGKALGYNAYAEWYNEQNPTASKKSTTDISDISTSHGTEVAGIIAMLIKEFGLENNIKIYPIKANTDSEGKFKTGSITKAIQIAISDKYDLDVINLSLGTLATSNAEEWATDKDLQNAINEAVKSAIVVAAAGNDSTASTTGKNSSIFYPAGLDGVISVMGYGENGSIYSTSNYGHAYDIVAPGESIYTAKSSSYSNVTGTSMATPFVSFGAALLKLRLMYEGVAESKLNGNSLSRMINSLEGKKISYKGYSFNSFDFNTLVTQPFDVDAYEYFAPTDLYFSYPTTYYEDTVDSFHMLSNNIHEIKFTATIQPYGLTNPDLDSVIEWYLIDGNSKEQLIGKGVTLTYAPKKGGQYKIVAKLTYDQKVYSDEVAWNIDFIPFYPDEARVTLLDNAENDKKDAPSKTNAYTTEPTILSLTGIQYCDTSSGIEWFVNDKYVASGETYAFNTKEAGTYTIYCKFNGTTIGGDNAFTIEVKPIAQKPIYLALIIVCVGSVVLTAILVVVIKARMKKKLFSEDLMTEQYAKPYQAGAEEE